VAKLAGFALPLTLRNRTDSKLAEQILALHAELVQQMAEGMVLIRASDGMILFANMAFERMFGYGPGELVGKQVAILNAQTDKTPEEIAKLITETLRQTSLWSGEIENVKKDGMRFWSLANVSTFVHPQYGEVWLSIHQDITERKKMENELERQARIDMLTGLNNRRHFFELAERELARAKRHGEPLSALMLDADHFKLFNDNYGHHIGDMVLQKLSEVCAQVLRENDILGRIGGEEFAILLPETDGSQALDAAERLRQAVANAEVQFAPDELIRFTVSIGVTSLVATDAKVDTLLKRSDEALYEAKNAGRNLVRVK
jgi:diguanylate cyclase (GGDEF)-like protein/PAS domain S-box-containing protein